MIDKKFIDEVKLRNPIEDVMAQYVTVKRSGSNLVCLCPFHAEKTPSCTIYAAEQNFHCFGCGVGGDVITFVRKIENLEYVEAIEKLAARAGIPVPEDRDARFAGKRVDKKRFYAMNRDAALFFSGCLYDKKYGSAGLEYLTVKRRLSASVIKHFGLGFAPASSGVLHQHMKSLGYTDKELVEGFLCGSNNGRTYDYFRNRVMFPIIDVSGNVIGFGGRVMDDSKPKYLNSSDNAVFHKRINLYALNFAKSYCKDRMVLCEGYMDVISVHAAGFPIAVATLGTAITPEQARIMSRYTKKVIIAYDSDGPGQTAAQKAFDILSHLDVDTKILKMTGAKDPDEFIKSFGAPAFGKLMEESQSRFEFTLENLTAKNGDDTDDGRIKTAAEIEKFIAGVSSTAEREIYIFSAAKKLGLSAESIKNDVEKLIKKKDRDFKKKENEKLRMSSLGIGDIQNRDYGKNVRAARAEEEILSILLNFPELFEKAADGTLTADDFYTDYGKKLFSAAAELASRGEHDISLLGEFLTADEASRADSILRRRKNFKGDPSQDLDVYIRVLKEETSKKTAENKDNHEDITDINDILSKKRNNT